MFSGIVKNIGLIARVTEKDGGREVEIAPRVKRLWKKGESVMISGICSTITNQTSRTITVFYMPETLQKTTAAHWKRGSRVNIEPSLRVGDDISGHFVTGHVDGMARVSAIRFEGETRRISFSLLKDLAKYLISKGSVAVDGVSLTVVDAGKKSFSVALIPFTLSHTTFGSLRKGDRVNIEVDQIAKHIEKYAAVFSATR